MEKFLDFDWVRAAQFQINRVPSKGNIVITTKLPFSALNYFFLALCYVLHVYY